MLVQLNYSRRKEASLNDLVANINRKRTEVQAHILLLKKKIVLQGHKRTRSKMEVNLSNKQKVLFYE